MQPFARTRSSTSTATEEKTSAYNSGGMGTISQSELDDFGIAKFEKLTKHYGKPYAMEQVVRSRKRAGDGSDEPSPFVGIEDNESFGLEDTDVWCMEDFSVECVLGGI